MQSPSSLYHDVVFPGGIKSTERGEIDNWPDIANLTTGGVVDADAEFAANRAHPTFDEFWHDRSFVDLPRGRSRSRCSRSAAGTTATSGPARSPTSRRSPSAPGRCTDRGSTSSRSPSSRTPVVDDRRRRAQAQVLAETPQMGPGVLLAWFDHWVAASPTSRSRRHPRSPRSRAHPGSASAGASSTLGPDREHAAPVSRSAPTDRRPTPTGTVARQRARRTNPSTR